MVVTIDGMPTVDDRPIVGEGAASLRAGQVKPLAPKLKISDDRRVVTLLARFPWAMVW